MEQTKEDGPSNSYKNHQILCQGLSIAFTMHEEAFLAAAEGDPNASGGLRNGSLGRFWRLLEALFQGGLRGFFLIFVLVL